MFGFTTRGKKVKVAGEEEDDTKPSEREIFGISGPTHITSVDWNSQDHRRSIAASLVQGVYILERDRQQNRQGNKALASIWWDYFHFQLIQILVDKVDGSSFGAIFEYTPKHHHHHNHHVAVVVPIYVLAFRGTVFKPYSRVRDLNLDMQLVLNNLTRNSRYQLSLQSVHHFIGRVGPAKIWLAGHSLGAAIALQAGKETARLGCYLETYLFNPPFTSPPIEKIKDQHVKDGIRIAGSLLTAGISLVVNSTSSSTSSKQHLLHNHQLHHDPFLALCPWVPYIFIHPNDPISSEYIGYFEHRNRMDSFGLGSVERIATKCSVVGMISGLMGRDAEAPHLMPSGFLVKNMNPAEDFKTAHGIHQWWKPHRDWVGQLYQVKS